MVERPLTAVPLRLIAVTLAAAGFVGAGRVGSIGTSQAQGGLMGAFVIDARDEVDAGDRRAQPDTGTVILPSATGPQPYAFFPQAGTLWQDLYVNNFVDLGGGSAPLDYECTGYSYIGHLGHDSDIAGFREQEIGVPIFAALDGVVVAAHDGEFDMNTSTGSQPANYVILDHGETHQSWYWHLKRGSVAVAVGQTVVAGTQLGLTGSSGSSTWPHLHFESRFAGTAYEPSAGPCRPGASYWTRQTPIRRDTYVRAVTFANEPFTGPAALPWDQVARTGSYVVGTLMTFFRLQIGNVPANAAISIEYRRPDGSTALTYSYSSDDEFVRNGWYRYQFNLASGLDVVGTWTMRYSVNGVPLAVAPFLVVGSAAQLANHPPNPITASLDPWRPDLADVPFCRVQTSLYLRDPDYDLVRYRYEWRINGALVRSVVSAALSDALPRGIVDGGDRLTCTVTPLDDVVAGPSAIAVSFGTTGDFDGDGRSDVAIYRPSTGAWYVRGMASSTWGGGSDIPVTGDFDGDGRADIAVYRPSTGIWYILRSSGGSVQYGWGGAIGDIPVAGDYDGDGRTDIGIFRPSVNTWYIFFVGTNTAVSYLWGGGSDIPVQADYDGDRRTDVAIFRPSTGVWYILRSSGGSVQYTWGGGGDVAVPGDYDGDGRADIGVFRASTSAWYILNPAAGTSSLYFWGGTGDIAVPGDYDGDARTDVAIFRPSTGVWYIQQSSTMTAAVYTWGGNGDLPILRR